jgi:hypothetical protein
VVVAHLCGVVRTPQEVMVDLVAVEPVRLHTQVLILLELKVPRRKRPY